MPSHLVIVESPAKARTIKRFLGKDYDVEASMGHVRDLPSNTIAVDTEKTFEPEYEIPDKSKKTIRELKAAAAKVDMIYLATDLDREGEAISWHVADFYLQRALRALEESDGQIDLIGSGGDIGSQHHSQRKQNCVAHTLYLLRFQFPLEGRKHPCSHHGSAAGPQTQPPGVLGKWAA